MKFLVLIFGLIGFVVGFLFLFASFGWRGPDGVAIIGIAIGTIAASVALLGLFRIIEIFEKIAKRILQTEKLER